MTVIVKLMINFGIALMLVNIVRYIRYERYVRKEGIWGKHEEALYIPIVLLILFFLGYIGIALFGNPHILVASILFGGSIFVFAMLELMWNVTKRIQEHDRLRTDLEAAKKANTSKTVFLSSMSHDIRTPLNAIIGYADLSKKEGTTLEEMRSYMTGISSSGKQLLELISDILEMSRIESGKITLSETPSDLISISTDMEKMFAVQMDEKGMDFTVDTSGITHRYVVCDRTLIERVLLNLLSNSYKYTGKGGKIRLAITETESKDGEKNRYEFRVSDNGIGMTKEFAEKIFDAFEREKTTTISGIQGTGLGMAITKKITDIMGGDIKVITSPGQGTEIIVYLFLAPCGENEVVNEEEQDDRVDIDLEGIRVLLVDDVEVNREIASLLLTDKGFLVETAENGKVAYDMVRQSEPGYYGVVLMDLQMPVMDGYEASKKIRELDDPYLSNIPIIAVTANAFEEDRKRAIDAGMNGHISKPVNQNELVKTLGEIVKNDPDLM